MQAEARETEELEMKNQDSDLECSKNDLKNTTMLEDGVKSDEEEEQETVLLWVPSGRRLISGLFGINVVLLGAALVAGDALNPVGLRHHEPEVFLLLLMGFSVVWMLWYLLWSRRQPGAPPHTDHHAGGATVTDEDGENVTDCECRKQPVCVALRKGYEVLYPFNMEFNLLASCMLYVMWKNVGRHVIGTHSSHTRKITLRIMRHGGVLLGLIFGVLVLIAGIVVFLLYQVWVGRKELRLDAFLMFYCFHICVIPAMVLCSLAGTLVYRWKESTNVNQHQGGKAKGEEGVAKNPTRSLDVLLLLGTGLGQLSLSYFSLVAVLAVGAGGILGNLHLSYSLLSLLELILQNIFIIQGLHSLTHTHPHSHTHSIRNEVDGETAEPEVVRKQMMKTEERTEREESPFSLKHDVHRWSKRAIQEICAFLILSNIMLWVIPAFGAHPQFESGVGKEFFGFSVWFVLVNLGQPLTVFYRMHSVGALMELFISA
ncbi:proton channel OTOP3-like isoform X3 [Neoarius graeffei]|uniref:proton channel OTOP3-like isoform X3 n=1 Tax=Neoarius graeffei TaxID=443677 RepID=UPI00298C9599|nr:proton channel OTOP3-like isoform X3 [Neoarius graeffei]